ncbi:hypothetical protein [Paracoccus zhejiangensis]|uniref:hypothetical protein n=1 Tax=Paracoccus zhejiangensis TaxID=1077935 RepID=UPI0013000539|nr:hypothetical protein [Paracoccus zhejiangensis]
MSDEIFYLKARMKQARAAVKATNGFGHKDSQYAELKGFLLDLAKNLAGQRQAEFDQAFGFVVRAMGEIARQNASEAYKPHGYKNPFEARPVAPAPPPKSPAQPKPLWSFPVINHPPKNGSSDF